MFDGNKLVALSGWTFFNLLLTELLQNCSIATRVHQFEDNCLNLKFEGGIVRTS